MAPTEDIDPEDTTTKVEGDTSVTEEEDQLMIKGEAATEEPEEIEAGFYVSDVINQGITPKIVPNHGKKTRTQLMK